MFDTDTATAIFPRFGNMGLEQAREAFSEWVDATWDFDKRAEEYKRIVKQKTSVKEINQLALRTAASGLMWKARCLK